MLNGAKRWIGNASIADVIVVWARDTDDGEVKAIVVEKNLDGTYPDGYTAELITGKIGKRAVWQPDVTLRERPRATGQQARRGAVVPRRHPRAHRHPRRRGVGIARPRRRLPTRSP